MAEEVKEFKCGKCGRFFTEKKAAEECEVNDQKDENEESLDNDLWAVVRDEVPNWFEHDQEEDFDVDDENIEFEPEGAKSLAEVTEVRLVQYGNLSRTITYRRKVDENEVS